MLTRTQGKSNAIPKRLGICEMIIEQIAGRSSQLWVWHTRSMSAGFDHDKGAKQFSFLIDDAPDTKTNPPKSRSRVTKMRLFCCAVRSSSSSAACARPIDATGITSCPNRSRIVRSPHKRPDPSKISWCEGDVYVFKGKHIHRKLHTRANVVRRKVRIESVMMLVKGCPSRTSSRTS
jgi:hypothetical protein